MLDVARNLFSDRAFVPHGMGYLWRPGILSLHIISDGLITLVPQALQLPSPSALRTANAELERRDDVDGELREFLTDIHRSVEDVMHTVTRMSEFYRAREPQFVPTPVPVSHILEQVVDITRARWHDMAQEQGARKSVASVSSCFLRPRVNAARASGWRWSMAWCSVTRPRSKSTARRDEAQSCA